jgi:hypothetical protein
MSSRRIILRKYPTFVDFVKSLQFLNPIDQLDSKICNGGRMGSNPKCGR